MAVRFEKDPFLTGKQAHLLYQDSQTAVGQAAPNVQLSTTDFAHVTHDLVLWKNRALRAEARLARWQRTAERRVGHIVREAKRSRERREWEEMLIGALTSRHTVCPHALLRPSATTGALGAALNVLHGHLSRISARGVPLRVKFSVQCPYCEEE